MALFNPSDPDAGAQSLLTQEEIERRRKIAASLAANATKSRQMTHPLQVVAQALDGLWAGIEEGRVSDAAKRAQAYDAGLLSGDLSAPGGTSTAAAPASAPSMAGGGTSRSMAMPVTPDLKDGIAQTASSLGISPVDLATVISYETGGTFDPTKAGPRTQWGQHRGLIQFGEPQAKEHGVDWSNPVASQLGPNGAIASYLKSTGVKPGMGLLDIYSAVNAGGVGRYGRSDANNGGAPGTVRDKVEKQMDGHRAKARALFAEADLPAPGASPVEAPGNGQGFAVPGGESARAMDGRTFNAISGTNEPVQPVFQSEGVGQPWMGTALAPAAPSGPQMVQAPMPPSRPADLAVAPSPADLPAPGAVPAIGQMPAPQPMPDLSNTPDGGARVLQALAEQQRQGQQTGPTPAMPVAQASLPAAAAPAPVQAVAQALGPQAVAPAAPASPAVSGVANALAGVNPRLVTAATSPYASPQTKAIAQLLIKQQLEQAQYNRPDAVEARRLGIDIQRKSLAKSDAPSSVQEFEYGQKTPGYNDWKQAQARAGAPKTEGTIPQGYSAERDAQGNITRYVPIPGSPAAKEAEASSKADKARTDSTKAQANLVLDAVSNIEKAMVGATLPTTGGIGAYLSKVPGTAAHDISNLVDTIEANVSFGKLNEMRSQSPTGGALGSVTERELQLLGASLASLRQSQTAEQFKRNLGIVRENYLDVVHGKGVRPKPATTPTGQTKSGVKWSID